MKLSIKNIAILTTIIMLFAALLTNPKKENYVTWCKEKVTTEATSELEKGLIALLAAPVVQSTTITKNFVLFSVYETDLGKEKIKVLGAFNNFIPISKGKSASEKSQGAT